MGWIFYEAYALAFAGHGTGHLPHRLRRLPVEYTGRYTSRAGNAPQRCRNRRCRGRYTGRGRANGTDIGIHHAENPSKILPKESGEAPETFPSSYALEADSPTEAYSKVLWYIFQYGLLPGETSWPTYAYSERAPGDSYVVYDIDNDGREELLFSLSGTTYVWEYRDSVLYEELRAFTYGLIIKCKNACRDAAGIFNCILAVFTC